MGGLPIFRARHHSEGFIPAAFESSQARATNASGKETPIDTAVFQLRDQIVPVARFCDITHGTRAASPPATVDEKKRALRPSLRGDQLIDKGASSQANSGLYASGAG
jgi:hypothetical protein